MGCVIGQMLLSQTQLFYKLELNEFIPLILAFFDKEPNGLFEKVKRYTPHG